MCLAIPGLIEKIEGDVATVKIGDVRVKTNIALVPEAEIGNYVLIHTGYAIQVLSPEEAQETLKLISEVLDTEE